MMVFTTSIKGAVLFEFWDVENIGQYIGTCFFVFALAALYEFLSEYRARLHAKTAPASTSSAVQVGGSDDQMPLIAHSVNVASTSSLTSFVYLADPWPMRLYKGLLHTIQLGLSYIIMLIAMTYNVGYFFSMLAGAFVGYVLFARVRAQKRDAAGCCAVEPEAK